ncbi:MAG: alpha/beta fold hydrolase [Rhodobacteraceae bacterium]|nr:MAG: alpha/beta fold hydrolase [Paracoccaceae bacterium]
MDAPARLALPDGGSLAYHRTPARGEGAAAPGVMFPGVMFLGGFASDMTGTKATRLEAWAKARGRAFLRFDYTGHGASSGRFEDGTIGRWAADAEAAFDALTEGPTILVGSSMGGWIALLLAMRRPERVAGFVGIAAAPDFTEDAMWATMTEAQRAALAAEGRIETPSAYADAPYVITRALIEDGRERLVLRAPLRLDCPVRLLQGSADADVPPSVALRLFEHLDAPDVRLELVKGADHRFSGPRELAIIEAAIESLSA